MWSTPVIQRIHITIEAVGTEWSDALFIPGEWAVFQRAVCVSDEFTSGCVRRRLGFHQCHWKKCVLTIKTKFLCYLHYEFNNLQENLTVWQKWMNWRNHERFVYSLIQTIGSSWPIDLDGTETFVVQHRGARNAQWPLIRSLIIYLDRVWIFIYCASWYNVKVGKKQKETEEIETSVVQRNEN